MWQGLCSAGSHTAAAAADVRLLLLSLIIGAAEAGLEAQESLLELRQGSGALGAAVLTGRGDGRRRGLLDEVVHPLAGVLVQVGFGKQSGDALEARFVAFLVALCGAWSRGEDGETWLVAVRK